MVQIPPRNTFGKDILAGIANRAPGAVGGTPRQIPLSDIEPDPDQPRRRIDQLELHATAATMQRWGVLQPIILRKGEERPWRIVHGERRWRAAQIAGLPTIPAFVEGWEGESRLARQVIENQHRADLPNSAIGRVIDLMTKAGERNADIALVVNLPEHRLKHYRVMPDIPSALAPWIDRLDMRTVYELYMAWTRADGQGRASLEAKLAAVDGDGALSLADARRIIQATAVPDDTAGTEDRADRGTQDNLSNTLADNPLRISARRSPPREQVKQLRAAADRLFFLVIAAADAMVVKDDLRESADRIRAEAQAIQAEMRPDEPPNDGHGAVAHNRV
jgi:ParB/RepB/Spo0J family partition protein